MLNQPMHRLLIKAWLAKPQSNGYQSTGGYGFELLTSNSHLLDTANFPETKAGNCKAGARGIKHARVNSMQYAWLLSPLFLMFSYFR